MNELLDKTTLLAALHKSIGPVARSLAGVSSTPREKAQVVNAAVAAERVKLIRQVANLPKDIRGTAALTIQYCCTVVALEYRNFVWPYEYMSFSRRIGELWESFCSTAWTYPIDATLSRFKPPSFRDVRDSLLARVTKNLASHSNPADVLSDVNTLIEIIGDINMEADEVFTKDGMPHVVDFKSGFGSNEKGNTIRLLTVGKAYRLWDRSTKLLLLVRQEQNNNYLNHLTRSGVWDVRAGRQAYKAIQEITGADINSVREKVLDWQNDLSENFYRHLKRQPSDLTAYLAW